VAKVLYVAMMSLDGYIEDEHGNFDWAAPNDEVHGFINNLTRPIGTYLYGRKMYDVMAVWETMHTFPDQPREILEFAEIWQAAEKIVYSRTLDTISSTRTRIETDFDPAAIRQMKSRSEHDLAIGGPNLAASAFSHGLVDECHLFIAPVVVGSGKHGLPPGIRIDLELIEERRFGNGMVYLHYRVRK
jgi:dihydrofolate reductase